MLGDRQSNASTFYWTIQQLNETPTNIVCTLKNHTVYLLKINKMQRLECNFDIFIF